MIQEPNKELLESGHEKAPRASRVRKLASSYGPVTTESSASGGAIVVVELGDSVQSLADLAPAQVARARSTQITSPSLLIEAHVTTCFWDRPIFTGSPI